MSFKVKMKFSRYPQVTKKQIDSFFKKNKISLPEDYANFLLNQNGGQPEEGYTIDVSQKEDENFDFSINVFFGIGGINDTSCDLLTMHSIYLDQIPEELLPIGDDGIGNLLCLGIANQYYGKVFIWWRDHRAEEEEEPYFDNVDEIANSFNQFLSRFRKNEGR